MVREEERGGEWRDTRDIGWHMCDALSETNSARQTEQKGERGGKRGRHRQKGGNQRGGA